MSRSHRDEFPRKVRAAIFLRAKGSCEACGAKLKVGEGEVDHILPVVFGGEPTLENGRLLCRVCHKAKTAKDIGGARKSERVRDKHTGAIRRRQWYPGLRKKINGQVVRRDGI